MTWPAVVAWVLILAGTLPRSPLYLLYLYFVLGAFGSLTLLPSDGFNLVPQACCAVFFIIKILFSKGQLSRAVDMAIDPAKLGLLFALLAYSLFSAYVMPRLFADIVEVVEMNPGVPWTTKLKPTSSNVSQSVYLTLSVGAVLAFSLVGENPSFRRHFMRALLVGGLVLIVTGIADLTFAATGLEALLEPFRNASYAMLINAEVLESKRVVGLMPEASSFGPACVVAAASLAFLRPCFGSGLWRNCLVPLTIAGLLAMTVLSASSTAIIGLAVAVALFAVNWLRRSLSPNAPARDGLKWEAIITVLAAFAVLAVIVLAPQGMHPVQEFLDELIFNKAESSSYAGRTMWTKAGMAAFFATHGLGVGLGSARTSNFIVAMLSNTGIIGGLLLGCFVLRLYFLPCRSEDPRTTEFVTALKFSLAPWLAMASVSWTVPVFDLGTASVLGLISSLTATSGMSSIRPGTRLLVKQIRTARNPHET